MTQPKILYSFIEGQHKPKPFKVTHEPKALILPLLVFLSPWIAAVLFVLACHFKTEIDVITGTLWFQSIISCLSLGSFVCWGMIHLWKKVIKR